MRLDYSFTHGLCLVYTFQCTGREIKLAYPLINNRSYYTLQMDELVEKCSNPSGIRIVDSRKQDLHILLHDRHDVPINWLQDHIFCFDELVELSHWMDRVFTEEGFLK